MKATQCVKGSSILWHMVCRSKKGKHDKIPFSHVFIQLMYLNSFHFRQSKYAIEEVRVLGFYYLSLDIHKTLPLFHYVCT